jgi:GNAT superfamily N-acetyltransferase
MTIRRAEPGDAEAIAEIFLRARAPMTYLPEVHTDAETREWIRSAVLPEQEVWVADEGGRLSGFAALHVDMLEHLYVHPDAQGRGIGTSLLGVAMERRPAGLCLWVFQRNENARRFYARHGFTLVRMTDGAANEEREPDALYEWSPGR